MIYNEERNSFYDHKIKWEFNNTVRYLTDDGNNAIFPQNGDQIWTLEPVCYPATFQVEDDVTYKIAAFAGSATSNDANNSEYSVKYLTADTMNNSSLNNNGRRVFLSNSTSNNTWKINFSGNKAHIIASDYPGEGINYYYNNGLGNAGVCDTIPFSGNTDSFMEFLSSSAESHIPVCKIHLVRDNTDLYLTADNSVNGAGVSWRPLDTDNPEKQLWHFVLVGEESNSNNGDGSSEDNNNSGNTDNGGTRTIIDLPSDRVCNWNQYYPDIVNTINSKKGCSWTCALNIANIYGPDNYEPSDMPAGSWTSDGCTWLLPSNCNGTIQWYSYFEEDSDSLSTIRSEINNNRPVIIELYNGELEDPQHFVVAYGYTNNGTTKSDILVFDPGVGDRDEDPQYGIERSLAVAESQNGENGKSKPMRRLRLTTGR